MKTIKTASAFIIVLTFGFGTCGFEPDVSAGDQSGTKAMSNARTPQDIYAKICGYCHGVNVGPVILGQGIESDSIEVFVRTGMGAMPAFRQSEISNGELKSLALWISKSSKNEKEHGK